MKNSIILGTVLFVVAIITGLIQLWFTPWNPELFLKLELTIGALFLIVLVIWFIAKEYKEDKSNRSGDRLE